MRLHGLALLAICSATLVSTTPTIQVRNGTLNGGKCDSTDVNYFLSIPYAAAPVGDLRFAAPQAFDKKYDSTRDATVRAPACVQFGTQFLEYGPQSEDCLFLDVWAPANIPSGSQLPVRVWLYGGANDDGGISDAMYNGCYTSSDSIQVNVNYRLGALGYLAVEAAGITGNYGLQDQLLALRWVHENIEAFGGNKSQVLLYGQSAGADDSFIISTLPQATSLVHAAVLQSGGGRDLPEISETRAFNEGYISALNCSVRDISCIRSRSTSDFNTTYNSFAETGTLTSVSLLEHSGMGAAWGPVMDNIVITRQPSEVGIQVAAIIGTTTEEGTLFALGDYRNRVTSLNQTDFDRFLTYNFGPFAATINQTYAVSKFEHFPLPVYAAMSNIVTDYGFRCPSYRSIQGAVKNGRNVWTYRFNHTSSCAWLTTLPKAALALTGPTHTADLPYVFGVWDNIPAPGGNCNLTSMEKAMGTYIQSAWTNMAVHATPGGNWPMFTVNGSEGIIFNDAPEVGVVDYSMCGFWDQISAEVSKLDANRTSNVSVPSQGDAKSGIAELLPDWTILSLCISVLAMCLASW